MRSGSRTTGRSMYRMRDTSSYLASGSFSCTKAAFSALTRVAMTLPALFSANASMMASTCSPVLPSP